MKKIIALILATASFTIAISFAIYNPESPAPNEVNLSSDGKEMPTLMSAGGDMQMYNNYNDRGWGRGDNERFEREVESHLQNLAPAALAGLLGAGILLSVIVLLGLAFWIWMLVHAVRHDIDYKPIWILVIWFMSIIGAIVYYFAVKRPADCYCCGDEGSCGNCDCEEGTCKIHDKEDMGEMKKEEASDKM